MSQRPTSQRERSLWDRTICAARSAYYLTERLRLPIERRKWQPRDNPLVSVIIPTYNRADLLCERALPSVLAQNYRNLQIIVAAHGCTDDTVTRAVAKGDERVLVVDVVREQTYPPTAENHWLAGPVVPINAALDHVAGDWIARIDDDDIWTEGHIDKLLDFAHSVKTVDDQFFYEFVSAAHETHAGKVEPYRGSMSTPVGGVQTWLYRSYLKFFRSNPDCWRKSWNRVNDTDVMDRMQRAGVRMGYLDEVVAKVLPRPGETEVGVKAYLADKDNKEREYAF